LKALSKDVSIVTKNSWRVELTMSVGSKLTPLL